MKKMYWLSALVILVLNVSVPMRAQAAQINIPSNQIDQGSQIYLPIILNNLTPPPPVRNGGFEEGMSYWDWYSSTGHDLLCGVTDLTFADAHGGDQFGCLIGYRDDFSYILQDISNVSDLRYLHYWYWIYSEDLCGYDFAEVRVAGGIIKHFDLCEPNNTNGWVHQVIDLSSYTGATIELFFGKVSDPTLLSIFLIDDISLSAFSTTTP